MTKKTSGQSIVEFALVLPIIIVLFAGILEFGMVLFTFINVADAASEGATFAAAYCSTPDCIPEVKLRAQQSGSGFLSLELDDIVVVTDITGEESNILMTDKFVEVTVTYDYNYIIPMFGDVLPLKADVKERVLAGSY